MILEEKGTPASLLTAPYTFVNAAAGPLLRPARRRRPTTPGCPRPGNMGVGLLAQGGLLAVESHNLSHLAHQARLLRPHPRAVRRSCRRRPPVVADLPPPTGAETTRQRYEVIHLADASCKACHKMFDPIGFAFEHLDATGRYREPRKAASTSTTAAC